MSRTVTVEMPEKADEEIRKAIFEAWDHYGPGKGLLGTPEAERIYKGIFEVLANRVIA